jgi:ubiquinol-cytochrome c reductase cytochrome c subunit
VDLTDSYSRLGSAGITAILSNPPFPLMKAAFVNKELTDVEIDALNAMFHFADQRFSQRPSKSTDGLMFAVFGFVLAMFILIHIYILYDNRKIPRP